jgi:transposase
MRLRLTRQQKEYLIQFTRRTKNVRLRRRALAILDLDAGDRPGVVACRYKVARSTIYNWIDRCQIRGLSDESLRDRPRPGRPPRLRSDERDGNHSSN